MNDFDASGLSMDQFRTRLLQERGVELYMEGHRFFDLTRMGVYDEYCKTIYGELMLKRIIMKKLVQVDQHQHKKVN